MKSVFVTRMIPDIGIKMLKDKGYEVDINPENRPLSKGELIQFLRTKPYDAVLSLLNDRIDAEVFDASPRAKIFANYTIGFDNFDVEEGKKRGVFLTNAPGGGADRVAEHVWALLLALTCRVVEGDRYMRARKYSGWDPMLFHGIKLEGKTIGLIGAGRIGHKVATIGAHGFGMKVMYYDIRRAEDLEKNAAATYCATVEEVLRSADVVSLHTPLTAETRHLINAERLALMKKSAYIINTSRGAVIEESALVTALRSGTIAGAGMDVYENEPELADGLDSLENVVLTPHIASSTDEDRGDMAVLAATNIIDVLEGGIPRNLVYQHNP